MKYLKQLVIILFITFIGELLNYFIPLPIPTSVYGMVLLYIALMTKIIKLSSVKETGKFLVDIMPVMFIPAGVGLLESWGVLSSMLLPIAVITAVTTVLVMAVSGIVTQIVIKTDKRTEKTEDGTK